MTASLAKLKKGHRFPTAKLDLSSEWVTDYVDAVEDRAIEPFGDLVPPMAIATLSLRALLERVELPGGAIHVGELLAWGPAVRAGQRLRGPAIIMSRGERSGWVLMTISHEVVDDDYEEVMGGHATVAFPIAESAREPNGAPPNTVASNRPASSMASLKPLVKIITQEKINRYAEVSGDHNPLHIDPAFAATTQFGGTIAHGMLVLACISEMMTASFGERWLGSSRLKMRFRGAARPGDTLTASGHIVQVEGSNTSCDVECRNQAGELLISGETEMWT